MSNIKLNYTEVLSEADKFNDLASKGEESLREIKNISANIPSFWTGQASNAFIDLCIHEAGELADLINSLYDISNNLKVIAKEIKAADDRAKMVINNSIDIRSNPIVNSKPNSKPDTKNSHGNSKTPKKH